MIKQNMVMFKNKIIRFLLEHFNILLAFSLISIGSIRDLKIILKLTPEV